MQNNPTGTVTFLFTDIEGSTKLAQSHPSKWDRLSTRHNELLSAAIQKHNGYIFQIVGDAFCAAFHTAIDALHAAIQSQTQLCNENWDGIPIRVRMGIHTGKADLLDSGDYRGYLALSRTQRLMSAGYGGQVLISLATEELIRDELPENVALRDMGDFRLKDLTRTERIHQLVVAGLPADFPPLKTLESYKHNLPIQLTSFIGREEEILKIASTIREHRLVTLTGVGGTGKTRLSLQVSADLLDDFPDGVWFIELAPITNPDLIPQAIVSALQLHEIARRTSLDTLTDFLGTRKALIILDNCEHLIQECAQLSSLLLQKCTKINILTTSREPLGIMGEVILSIPSLNTPQVEAQPDPSILVRSESVRLFIDRACTIHPTFTLTERNAGSVLQICSRLDGIPLALELAAARIRGMGVDQIASRLDHRFRLLTGGSRTSVQRQQTLSATVDWSYNLLNKEEKQLFQMLAVFIGPFSLQAIEEVCKIEGGDTIEMLDLVQRLVDKSLLITEERNDETYYRLLETIRQYGRDKLLVSENTELLADRHANFFMKLAKQARFGLGGPDQIAWTNRSIVMRDNFRAALEWVIEAGKTETALHLVCDLHEFWLRHSDFEEGTQQLERVLDLPDASSFSEIYLETRNNFSWMLFLQGKTEEALVMAEQNLAATRSQTNKSLLVESLCNLGMILIFKNEFARSRSYLEEAVGISRKVNDDWHAARALMDLAVFHKQQKQYKLSHSLYLEAYTLYQKLGDIGFQSVVLRLIGMLEISRNNFREGEQAHCESLKIARAVKSNLQIAYNLWGLAMAAIPSKDHMRAVRLSMACKRLCESIAVWAADDEREMEEYLAPARTTLSNSEFQSAADEGWMLTTEQAIEYALEVMNG